MCARSISLFGIGVSALAAVVLIGHADPPRQQPAPPATPSWRRFPTNQWQIADGATILRFAPDAVGLPTLHTVVDAGADARELWYLPWIHDHPNPGSEPLPEMYIDSLANALVHFGAQVDVIGMEGEMWVWDIRNETISAHADEVITPGMVDIVRAIREEFELEYLLSPPSREMATRLADTGVARAEHALLTYTTTPVIGVEDPELKFREDRETIDPAIDRERSSTAGAVLLAELEARRGHRALLVFGMAHYAEIEDQARRVGDITLRVACIPALCGNRAP